jgi:ABC-type spermidine/putrescine transport system permease subunit I
MREFDSPTIHDCSWSLTEHFSTVLVVVHISLPFHFVSLMEVLRATSHPVVSAALSSCIRTKPLNHQINIPSFKALTNLFSSSIYAEIGLLNSA